MKFVLMSNFKLGLVSSLICAAGKSPAALASMIDGRPSTEPQMSFGNFSALSDLESLLLLQADGSMNIQEAMDSWGITSELLENLFAPTEDKVTCLIDAIILSWSDANSKEVPAEIREEMLTDLEHARELGLKQVQIFNVMLKLKSLIDDTEDKTMQGILRESMLEHRRKFIQLQAEESRIFAKQDAVRRQFMPAAEALFSNLDRLSSDQALKFRREVVLRQFIDYVP